MYYKLKTEKLLSKFFPAADSSTTTLLQLTQNTAL